MAHSLTTPNTVLGVLVPKSAGARLATNLLTIVLGSLFIAICTKINVLTVPVPVTLQTFAVAALAAGFGWRIGVATVALYIVEGLSGLPVFAYGGGPAYVLSPSFGFILGYLPMALIIGRAADLGASGKLFRLFGWMLVGDAAVFVLGYLWLLAVAGMIVSSGAALPGWLDATNLFGTAFDGAIRPFVIWDIVKMAFAALTVAGAWSLIRRKS